MNIEIRECKANEIDEWFSVCSNNFETDNFDAFQIPYYREGGSGKNQIMVVLRDRTIIGGFRIVKRELYILGKYVPMVGITDLNVRKGSELNIICNIMNYIVRHVSEENSICYGYTRLDMPFFYRKYEIEDLIRYYELIRLPREISMESYETIRPYEYKDLYQIEDIYKKDITEKGIGIYRSEQYWESCILPQIKYACIYEKNGTAAGYMICREIDKAEDGKLFWSVDEFHEIYGSNCFHNLLVGMRNRYRLPNIVKIPRQYVDESLYHKLRSFNNIKLKWKSNSMAMQENIQKLQEEVWIWELDNF